MKKYILLGLFVVIFNSALIIGMEMDEESEIPESLPTNATICDVEIKKTKKKRIRKKIRKKYGVTIFLSMFVMIML